MPENDERINASTQSTRRYDGLSGRREARIEDISMGVAFVNTQSLVEPGEVLRSRSNYPQANGAAARRGNLTSTRHWIWHGVHFSHGGRNTHAATDNPYLAIPNFRSEI